MKNTIKSTINNISDYLYYCSKQYSIEDSKDFTLSFINSKENLLDYSDINKIDFCWFLNLGFLTKYYIEYEQSDDLYKEIIKRLDLLKARLSQKTQTVKLKPVIKKPIDEILNSIDYSIDKYIFTKKENFTPLDISKNELKVVKSYIQKQIDEVNEDDEQYFNSTKLKKFLNDLLLYIEKQYMKKKGVKSKQNKLPLTVKKDLNIKKKVSTNVPYHPESINTPISVIGKKSLIIFDTKFKVLYLFKSLEKNGFYFSGKSLRGYDEDISCGKKIKKSLDISNMNLDIFNKIPVDKIKNKSLFSNYTRILYVD
jgi:hypothetical protein